MFEIDEKKKLWVVEDDAMIRWVYQEILSETYEISYFATINDFNKALMTSSKPHLIISDLHLTDGNFIDFLKGNLSQLEGIPYLIVSADSNADSLQFCLDKEGTVDYLTKPFRPNELLIKLERFFLHHFEKTNSKVNQLNDAFLNSCLTYKESRILTILMKKLNYFVARKEIIENIWANTEMVNPKTLDVHIYNLRKKIEPLNFQIYSDCTGRLKLV